MLETRVTQELFTPWTMKSSQGLVKSAIGYWTCLGTTSITPRKKSQSDHEAQGPQKTYFKAYTMNMHDLMGFVVGEAKEVL